MIVDRENMSKEIAEIIEVGIADDLPTHLIADQVLMVAELPSNGAPAQSAGMGATGWHLIETAPKDGSHILVRNSHNPNIPPTTVHWFDGGWHLSVNQIGEYSEYIWGSPTHWVGLWVQGADDTDEAYEIGKRDGYEDAIQDLDLATGGDGEFFGSTIPGRTVDLPAMKARIIARCGASSLAEGSR